jgi:uncharacterized protein (TIGR01777 family)
VSSKLKILVTGGSGVLGQELIPRLKRNGFEVRNLSTDKNKCSLNSGNFFWDPQRAIIDIQALQNIDVVIHLAGANLGKKRWTEQNKIILMESRVKTLEFLEQQFKKMAHFPSKLISMSGIGFYPDPTDEILTEESRMGNHFLARICSGWENAAHAFEKINTQVTILRTGPVLSKSEGLIKAYKMLAWLRIIPITGNKNNFISWVHEHDICNAIEFSVVHSLPGIYNVVSPNPSTQIEFVNSIALARRKHYLFPVIPAFLLKIIYGEKSMLALTNQNVSAKKIEGHNFKFKYSEITDAVNSLENGE